MLKDERIKKISDGAISFSGGFTVWSAFFAFMNSDWYCSDPVWPLLAALVGITAGGFAARLLKNVAPVLLMILSGGVVLLLGKEYPDAAAVLGTLLAGILIGRKPRDWMFLGGLAAAGLPGISVIWQDQRLLWIFWGWGMCLPAILLAWREFLYFRTWIAIGLCVGLWFVPAGGMPGPLLPPRAAFPALLLPETGKLRIAYVVHSDAPEVDTAAGIWKQFPFVEEVAAGNDVCGVLAGDPFELIVFDHIPVHSAAAAGSLLEQAWDKLADAGALVVPQKMAPAELRGRNGIVLPGSNGKYAAFLKGKENGNITGMDRRLQQHFKDHRLENSFMPPGVFKALFYEDVYGFEPQNDLRCSAWGIGLAGLAALFWVGFVLFLPGRDGSVWGNGCWFGMAMALLVSSTGIWEIRETGMWYWFPLVFAPGFLLACNSGTAARSMLGISALVPFALLLSTGSWCIWGVAAVSACSCGMILDALTARAPEKRVGLFCKYAAGCVCGVLIFAALEQFSGGDFTAALIAMAGIRGISLFRF